MSDLASFTGKFRAHGPESSKVTKRPRPTLTCIPCRKAKLKCDKGQPCSTCVKRDDAARCSYGNPSSSESSTDPQNIAVQKLAHLEAMVLQLMETPSDSQPKPGTSSTQPLTPPNFHHDDKLIDASPCSKAGEYAGSTHWSAMLDDIQGLRSVLNDQATWTEASAPGEVIYGLPGTYSLERLVLALPPKPDVERLLAIYFSGETFILPILHTGHFQRQCQRFWNAPLEVEPLWLSMLFSLCFMAAKIATSTGNSIVGTGMSALQTAAGQCLVLGNYHRPQRYAPEALLLYAQAKNFHSLDPSRDVGTILGMAVRHSYHMGYHRDPTTFGTFSVFDGEMRRRFWATCKQLDLMVSFQLGLPSHIRLENSDTRPPRNLLDTDFDEGSTKLPPSRPEDEPTRFMWFIVKDRQMVTFIKICQDALSFGEKSYADVQQLDLEVHQMYDSVPLVLRSKPFSQSSTDSPFLVMTRLYIEFIYLKSLCVLHRRHMTTGRLYSLKAGSEAAKTLMARFLDMYQELGPGGQLEANKWMLNSFTINDFLLGTTTACLAIHQRRQSSDAEIQDAVPEEPLLDLLSQALRICSDVSDASKDVQRVSHVVRLVLNGFGSPKAKLAGPQPDGDLPWTTRTTDQSPIQNSLQSPETSAIFGQLDPFDFINNPIQDSDWSMLELEFGLTQDYS